MKNTHIHPRISTSINTCKQPYTYEHLQETLGLTILLSVSLPFEMEFQLKNILMNSKKKSEENLGDSRLGYSRQRKYENLMKQDLEASSKPTIKHREERAPKNQTN